MSWRFVWWIKSCEERLGPWSKMGTQARSAWRRNWTKEQADNYVKKVHTKSESQVEVESKRGVMLNMDAMIKREGGRHSPAAVAGAYIRAKKCIELGADWCGVDKYSGRMCFRYVGHTFESSFRREW